MINKVLVVAMMIFALIARKKIPQGTSIPKYVFLFAIIPFISMIGAHIFHGQSWRDCINATFFNLSYFIFFLLLFWKIREKDLIKMLIAFGLVFSLIELIQEFTYPRVLFYNAQQDQGGAADLGMRNGLYRFRMAGVDFAVFLFFYSFQSLMKKINIKYIVFLFVGAIGIYLSLTRQIMAASLGAAVLVYVFAKKNKFRNLIVLGIFLLIIYSNMDVLFGAFINQTNTELDSDYIRFLSYNFYGVEWNHGDLLRCIIGNGFPYWNLTSPYGREINDLQSVGIYASDVGIVGMYAFYGAIYVVFIVTFLVYAFRNYKYMEPYVKMYLLYSTFTLVMLWSFGFDFYGTARTGLFMYLIYLNIIRNKDNRQVPIKNIMV